MKKFDIMKIEENMYMITVRSQIHFCDKLVAPDMIQERTF